MPLDGTEPKLQSVTCKNCGNLFTGKYCSNCGEKVYTRNDKKLSGIFHEVFHFITHFEGTFFTTVKTFFGKPGKLSADYCFGKRKKYFKPISFFMLLVILYLLFPKFEGLNMRLASYINPSYGYSWFARPLVKSKMNSREATYKQIEESYEHTSAKTSKLALLLLIPLCAVLLLLLYITRKRPFFDHFILATEINSFYIFSHFLFLPFFAWIVEKIMPAYIYLFNDGSWVWWTIFIFYALFTIRAMKTFYQERWWLIILKGLIFLFIFAAYIRYVYAMLLFLLVMMSI